MVIRTPHLDNIDRYQSSLTREIYVSVRCYKIVTSWIQKDVYFS